MSDITSKLLDRVKKAGERSREVKQKEVEPKQQPTPAVPKKELVIPKKETTAIPTSSLLAGMVIPPSIPPVEKPRPESSISSSSPGVPPRPSSTTRISDVIALRSGTATPPPRSTYPEKTSLTSTVINPTMDKHYMMSTNPPMVTSTTTMPIMTTSSNTTTTTNNNNNNAMAPVSVTRNVSKKMVLQDRVWESLSELCVKMDRLENSPFQLGPAAVGPTVDLSTSFLRPKEYDWFDVDDDGNIVLQPKIPIFPEDFPPGMPEWPLSWWGIVDPAVGERKVKVEETTPAPEVIVVEEEDDDNDEKDVEEKDKDKESKPVESNKEDRKRSRSRERSTRRSRSRDRPSKRTSNSREPDSRRVRRDSPDSYERRSRSGGYRRGEDRPPYRYDRRKDDRLPYPEHHRREDRPPNPEDRPSFPDERLPYAPNHRGENRPPYPIDRRRDDRPTYPMDRRRDDGPPYPDDIRIDDRPPYPDGPRPLDEQYGGRRHSKSPPGRYGRYPDDRRRREDRRDRPRYPEDRRGRRPDDN